MQFGKLEKANPLVKLCVWLALLVVGFILVLAIILPLLVSGNVTTAASMRWILTAQDLFVLILPAWLAACLWNPSPARWLHVGTGMSWRTALIAVGLMVAAMPAVNMIGAWNAQMHLPDCLHDVEEWMKQMEDANARTTETLLGTDTIGGLLANIGLIGLLAAIGEEMTFRGVILGMLRSDNGSPQAFSGRLPHAAIWVTAIVFSAIHVQFYGFVPRMLMGALLGYALCWTGSLWVPVLMHFTNNTVTVIAGYVVLKKGIDSTVLESFGTGQTLWLGIVSLMITVVGAWAWCQCLRRSTTINNASSRTSIGS